jgi:LexA-binding, inner membrane-associated putative hydrolase
LFIGHYAVALASKRFAPRTSLGALIAAASLLDLLWPVFILLGWEQVRIEPGNTAFTPLDFISYPISHSLVAASGWATLFALLYYLVTRYRRGALLIWVGVVSHWLLDWISHRPDMPLYPNGPRFGLGLWNSVIATVIVEGFMFAIGVWIYLRVTRAKDVTGKWGLLAFLTTVCAVYVANIFSPPPPSVRLLGIGALSLSSILIWWAWWADRHREAR